MGTELRTSMDTVWYPTITLYQIKTTQLRSIPREKTVFLYIDFI